MSEKASSGIRGVDHIGVAVKDPRSRLRLWVDAIGLELERVEAVPTEGVRTWFLSAGSSHVELLEATSAETPVGRHLERRGEGVHHLCIGVDDLDAAIARLVAAGVEPIGGSERSGAGGARVVFVHPRDTGGVLIELSERPAAAADPFAPGTVAVLYLREPREQLIGVIHRIDERGVAIEGLGLDSWDDWVAQWARCESGPLAPSLQLFPVGRIEKVLADRDSDDLPSLGRRFEERTGRRLGDALTAAPSRDLREGGPA